MSVHRLKHGYLGYNGHIINVAQDACILYDTIPRKWDNLELVSFVKEDQKGNKRVMKVNKGRVVAACHWLKTYNPDYADVVIDTSHLPEVHGPAAAALAFGASCSCFLPGMVQGEVDVAELIPTVEEPSAEEPAATDPGVGGGTLEDLDDMDAAGGGHNRSGRDGHGLGVGMGPAGTGHEDAVAHGESLGDFSSMTFGLPTNQPVTEMDLIDAVASGKANSLTEKWPERQGALDERTLGLMNKAFPTLFPGGTWQWVVDGVPRDVRSAHPGAAWHPGLEHQLVPVPSVEVSQKDPDTLINFQHGCDKNARRPYIVASKKIWEHLMRHHSGRFQSHARWSPHLLTHGPPTCWRMSIDAAEGGGFGPSTC